MIYIIFHDVSFTKFHPKTHLCDSERTRHILGKQTEI